MLPPVEDAVLQDNPEFAALHNTLTAAILNTDGTTRNDPAAKERDAVRKELYRRRLRTAKEHLLTSAISTAAPAEIEPKPAQWRGVAGKLHAHAESRSAPSSSSSASSSSASPCQDLPEFLLELLVLLPPILQQTESSASPPQPDSLSLLLSTPPLSLLPDLLPQLAALVSSLIHAQAVLLARVANPATNASFVHRLLPQLAAQISALSAALRERKAALTKQRLAAAADLLRLLQSHTHATALLLRALEAKHGGVARSLELKAAGEALAAQRAAVDAEGILWGARRDVYTAEAVGALRNYGRHLRDGRVRLGEAVRSRRAELEAYGVDVDVDAEMHDGGGIGGGQQKERTMREMARVYREMERQVDDARRDLRRLSRA